MSGKNLGLEFLPYMLLTNQYAGFLKVVCLKNEFKYDIGFLYMINKVFGLSLARQNPKFFRIINQEYIQIVDIDRFIKKNR